MKSAALNRILEKAPAQNLAVLSVCAFLRCDSIEIDRIYGALPSHGKKSKHEFLIRHHFMTERILLWTVEYWKTIATARACLVTALASQDDEATSAAFLADAQNAKLISLVEALRRICADSGINFGDVSTFAGVDTDLDVKPIPPLVEEYIETFGVVI